MSPSAPPPFRLIQGAEARAALARGTNWATLWARVTTTKPPPRPQKESAPDGESGAERGGR
jgi:hypothetical protein